MFTNPKDGFMFDNVADFVQFVTRYGVATEYKPGAASANVVFATTIADGASAVPWIMYETPVVVGSVQATAAVATRVREPQTAIGQWKGDGTWTTGALHFANEFERALRSLGVDREELLKAASAKPQDGGLRAQVDAMSRGIPIDDLYHTKPDRGAGATCETRYEATVSTVFGEAPVTVTVVSGRTHPTFYVAVDARKAWEDRAREVADALASAGFAVYFGRSTRF
jgi:hypothetical protein